METHHLAGQGVDDDASLPRDKEEDVIGAIEIFNDWLARLVTPPVTVLFNTLASLAGEALEEGHAIEIVLRPGDGGLRHAGAWTVWVATYSLHGEGDIRKL